MRILQHAATFRRVRCGSIAEKHLTDGSGRAKDVVDDGITADVVSGELTSFVRLVIEGCADASDVPSSQLGLEALLLVCSRRESSNRQLARAISKFAMGLMPP